MVNKAPQYNASGKRTLLIFILIGLALLSFFSATKAQDANYPNNQNPLVKSAFVHLPLGSVRPRGWLLKQMELQKEGLSGDAEELYSYIGDDSPWLGGPLPIGDPSSHFYAQEMWAATIYLRGLVPLAYTLDDEELKNKITKWVDWFLQNQKDNGQVVYEKYAWSMLDALVDLYEVTKDQRLLDCLKDYASYRYSEAKTSGVMRLETLIWLYNKTGFYYLIQQAQKTNQNIYFDWTAIYTNNTFEDKKRHGVGIASHFRYPPLYSLISNKDYHRDAFFKGHEHLMEDHGHVVGMNTGDEWLAGRKPWRGVELCAIVERMLSNEYAMHALGDPRIGDQLERIAFNALPAALTSDIKGHTYYVCDNLIEAQIATYGFQKDYETCVVPSPTSGYPCCRFMFHMGWPKYTKNMWAATGESNGLAALAYGPSQVDALVGDSVEVTITQDTHYPFDSQIQLTISPEKTTQFPLKLRIPQWCDNPEILVNGTQQNNIEPGSFYTIERTWSAQDQVTLSFPMKARFSQWYNQSVALERGPLVYSMDLNEEWWETSKEFAVSGYHEYEITTDSKWNYAFDLNPQQPEESITVEKHTMPENPFEKSQTPISLQVPMKQLPNWTRTGDGLKPEEPPKSPVNSSQTVETIKFVPYGATALRMTSLPITQSLSTGNRLEADSQPEEILLTQTENNQLIIQSSGHKLDRIRIFDMQGRLLIHRTFLMDE